MTTKRVFDRFGLELNVGDKVITNVQGILVTLTVKEIHPNSKDRQLVLNPGGWYKIGNMVQKVVGG